MGSALLPDLGTEIVIPVCAVVGIVFSLFQWYLVSRVKVSSERGATSPSNNNKNGYGDYLIEEEEGINDQNVIGKCADIQNAISEDALAGTTNRGFRVYRGRTYCFTVALFSSLLYWLTLDLPLFIFSFISFLDLEDYKWDLC